MSSSLRTIDLNSTSSPTPPITASQSQSSSKSSSTATTAAATSTTASATVTSKTIDQSSRVDSSTSNNNTMQQNSFVKKKTKLIDTISKPSNLTSSVDFYLNDDQNVVDKHSYRSYEKSQQKEAGGDTSSNLKKNKKNYSLKYTSGAKSIESNSNGVKNVTFASNKTLTPSEQKQLQFQQNQASSIHNSASANQFSNRPKSSNWSKLKNRLVNFYFKM
jgi:hypothetical protein